MDDQGSTPSAPRLTDLELQILLAPGGGPLHGYGIVQDIRAPGGDGSGPGSGAWCPG